MPDREKVIKGLECCAAYDYKCNDCPYQDDGGAEDGCYSDELKTDALALLKAQEPEAVNAPKPDSDIGCWYDITHNYTLEQVVSALKAQETVKPTEPDEDNTRYGDKIEFWEVEEDAAR